MYVTMRLTTFVRLIVAIALIVALLTILLTQWAEAVPPPVEPKALPGAVWSPTVTMNPVA